MSMPAGVDAETADRRMKSLAVASLGLVAAVPVVGQLFVVAYYCAAAGTTFARTRRPWFAVPIVLAVGIANFFVPIEILKATGGSWWAMAAASFAIFVSAEHFLSRIVARL